MPPPLPVPILRPDDPDILVLGTLVQNGDTTVSLLVGAEITAHPSEQVGVLVRDGTVTAVLAESHLPTIPRTVTHLLLMAPDGPREAQRLNIHETITALLPYVSASGEGAPLLRALEALVRHVGGGLVIRNTDSWNPSPTPPPEETDHELVEPRTIPPTRHVLVDTAAMEGPPEGYQFQNATDTLALAPFDCALITDEGIFVQTPEQVLTLSGLGAFIWDHLHREGTAGNADLLGAALDALGDHPNAQVLVHNAVATLVEQGALTRNWVIIGGRSMHPTDQASRPGGIR